MILCNIDRILKKSRDFYKCFGKKSVLQTDQFLSIFRFADMCADGDAASGEHGVGVIDALFIRGTGDDLDFERDAFIAVAEHLTETGEFLISGGWIFPAVHELFFVTFVPCFVEDAEKLNGLFAVLSGCDFFAVGHLAAEADEEKEQSSGEKCR